MRAWAPLLAVLLLPLATAQSPLPAGHVLHCSRECLPQDVAGPDATQTPVPTILYMHPQDILQRAPMNIIPPSPGKSKDVNQGYISPTVKVREGVVYFDNNWFTAYQLPRPTDPANDSVHLEEPLAFPLRLGDGPAKVYWYMSAHAVPQSNSQQSPAGGTGALARLQMYARLESGPHAHRGTLIAEGSTSAAVVVGAPGTDYAYEFEIPLTIKNRTIAPDKGLLLSLNWFQYADGSAQVAQADWRIRTGFRFLPRLILPVEEPIRVLDAQWRYHDGIHYMGTELASVFGAYDLNPFDFNLTFRSGPSAAGNATPMFYLVNPQKPLSVKVLWSIPKEQAPRRAGVYTYELAASNLMQTYRHHENVTFEILGFGPDPNRKSPGLEPVALLAALAFALVWTRPRRR